MVMNGESTGVPEMAELHEFGRGGAAVSRKAARWAFAQLQAQRDGHAIHEGAHVYVSTYCQHGTEQDRRAVEQQIATAGSSLHEQCRRSCKVCGAPCQCGCHAPGGPGGG